MKLHARHTDIVYETGRDRDKKRYGNVKQRERHKYEPMVRGM